MGILFSALLLPVGNWLYQLYKTIKTFGANGKLQTLTSELDQLKHYRNDDKTPHLTMVLDSFLNATLLIIVGEVCLYYISGFVFTKSAPLDVFAYFYLLMIYGYVVFQTSRRLRRIMRPGAYIAQLEKKIERAKKKRI